MEHGSAGVAVRSVSGPVVAGPGSAGGLQWLRNRPLPGVGVRREQPIADPIESEEIHAPQEGLKPARLISLKGPLVTARLM